MSFMKLWNQVFSLKLAYFRFHGRNKESWWEGAAATRYDYLYSDAELQDVAVRLKNISEKADILLVVFNNHARAQAAQNAKALMQILSNPD